MATTSPPPTAIDWASWLRRWDAQQQLHIPDREARFTAMVDALVAFVGTSPRLLDLGCGPGSLSARVLQRMPDAEIVAIDTDPVLLTIGRGALAGHERLHFVDADMRGDWTSQLPLEPPFDAAISTTALHWLGLPELLRLYGTLAQLLRPRGVLLDGDRLDFDHDQRTIAAVSREVQPEWPPTPEGAEDYDTWWSAAMSEPALADSAAERKRRHHDHPHDNDAQSYEFHRAALLAAGFAEVGTIWQRLANRVLLAVR
ncbi:MAG: class I SAM-dependent methyltransferase [Candidatus Dormibacteraeota bacterium]|nr:class I SAM-dependent methyltransferase [Candidatus Dormibacteraeota bacterium]MBV9524297.1 class I SAM-dependent methyltransferase [Candidatus Dormibacteraeota bacterium]